MGPAGKNSFMEQDMYYEEDEGEQGGSIEDNSAGRFDSVDSKKEQTKWETLMFIYHYFIVK